MNDLCMTNERIRKKREVKNGITCTTNELKRSKQKQFFMYDSFAAIHFSFKNKISL